MLISLKFFFAFWILIASYNSLIAQDKLDKQEALKVFIECDECDFFYLQSNIPYLNYTRDPQSAEVVIKITHQNTGSGGRKYTLSYSGQMTFKDFNQKLEYISAQIDSRDDDRKGLTKMIEMGLMPFLSQTFQASSIDINYEKNGKNDGKLNDDPWNSWTFHIDFMGDYEAEESQNELSLTSELRANHTTEELKIRSRAKYDFEEEEIKDDDETVSSTLRELEADLKLVRSIDQKWSYGFNTGINATTFRNLDYSISFAPAIEYNFFPWKESDNKVAALSYYAGIRKNDYIERTIYGKNSESIWFEGISLQFEIIEPWWEIDTDLNASHFFNDFKRNKIEFNTHISLKIIKGFSVVAFLSVERLRDQVYLPEEGATLEEILLKRKKLATDYELYWRFGLQYSFGSIYNNVVNRRM